ncbi:MAG: DUF91 domain-containing protein [Blastocatellia bacterium]|nr:DUF91 domain-containing protein [Blastocatellia bacterium]
MTERDLEDLLVHHPYLIDREFDGMLAERQLTCKVGRIDIRIKLPDGWCIVELKKNSLTPDDVRQLLRYCKAFSGECEQELSNHHYLIGKRPLKEKYLLKALPSDRFEVRILYLGEHIPLQLAWDMSTRRYLPYDSSQPQSDHIILRF